MQALAFPAFPVINHLANEIPAAVWSMFLWDPQEEGIHSMVPNYVLPEPAMSFVNVPGDNRQSKVVSERVRNTTAALVHWVIHLHIHGFAVAGPLHIHYFRVLRSGSIKGTRQLLEMLVPLALNEPQRATNMSSLATLLRNHLYQIPIFGAPPPDVEDLLNILDHFAPNLYILVKSHSAFKDAIQKGALFNELYGKLMTLKERNLIRFKIIIGNIHINKWAWICSAMNNFFLHQLIRFSSNPGTLLDKVRTFLSTGVNFGGGGALPCLRVRRNGESHLSKDYCAGWGMEEAFHAAIAAVTVVKPALGNLANLQANIPAQNAYGYMLNHLRAPFPAAEAGEIANVIVNALNTYCHSRDEAAAAARAAAVYVAGLPRIFVANPYVGMPQPGQYLPHGLAFWQTSQRQILLQNYTLQCQTAEARAQNAAQTVEAAARLVHAPPYPLMARNLFDIKDRSNMLELMEPRLLCELQRAMFMANELQDLEWHWDYRRWHLRE